MLNEAALTFMLSIGHRTGLLDTLRRLNRAATTHEIADEAGLDERYVREWLGALVTGRVIDYDPQTRGYRLPPEHAAWLTREATPNNLAGVMQFMSMFGKVEDQVLDASKMAAACPTKSSSDFTKSWPKNRTRRSCRPGRPHPAIGRRTGGVAERGVEALDVGCGRGLAMMHLAKRFPNSRFVGYDFSKEAIDWARCRGAATRADERSI